MTKSKPTWLKTISCVAWDLDGTLYPTSEGLSQYIHQQVITKVAEQENCSTDQAKQLYQTRYQELHSNTKTLESFGINGKQFFLSLWENHDLSPYIKPNPELATSFKKLKQTKSYFHVIHTNSNTLGTVKKKLDLIGLDPDIFQQIITSVDIGHNKPDERMFKALIELTKTPPAKILYVGDREHTDIIPAKNLGLYTALVDPKETNSKADITVNSAEQLLELLKH